MKKIATLALASMISTATIAVPAEFGRCPFRLGRFRAGLRGRRTDHPLFLPSILLPSLLLSSLHPYYYRTYYHPYYYHLPSHTITIVTTTIQY